MYFVTVFDKLSFYVVEIDIECSQLKLMMLVC